MGERLTLLEWLFPRWCARRKIRRAIKERAAREMERLALEGARKRYPRGERDWKEE